MKMKSSNRNSKNSIIIVCLLLITTLASCTSSEEKSGGSNISNEIVVFAAASLTECFTQVKEAYEEEHTDTEIVLNFAGSQVLKNQIDSGASPDMYFSANTKYPLALVESGIMVAGQALSEDDIDVFAKNHLVIISAWDKVTSLDSFIDNTINEESTIILAHGDVPVGKYTISMIEAISESLEDQEFYNSFYNQVVSYENDVKAVLAKVKLKEADYGIVYGTDAITAKESIYEISIPDDYNQVATYGSLLLSDSDCDIAFYEYMTEGNGQSILEEFGFVID